MPSAKRVRSDPKGKKFVRERRYFVIKISDARKVLSQWHLAELTALGRAVDRHRRLRGKPALQCLVIENDWPEFEPTWKAIEARMQS